LSPAGLLATSATRSSNMNKAKAVKRDWIEIYYCLDLIKLRGKLYPLFGEFQIYFEPTGLPYQYKIDSTEQSPFLHDPLFPVTRTLALSRSTISSASWRPPFHHTYYEIELRR
jgi:hypothetical protein